MCVVLLSTLLHAASLANCVAQSLRTRADEAGVLVGTAVDPSRFAETAYASTLAREFNLVEPENVLKWGTVRPDRRTFNFGPGDKVVAFAQAHQMKVRGHTLLWSEYNPAWLTNGRYSHVELRVLLRQHITKVMRHYAGQVFAWDVVNESFLADGRIESSIWYDQPGIGLNGKGTAYIEQAFRWARAADPKALLFYNDYDAEVLNAKSDAIYAMVREFKQRGVPIDGIGMQAHIFDMGVADLASMSANIERFAALGVQVHITEMDVGLPIDASGRLRDQTDLAKQADIYRYLATTCLRQPRCTAFQTWGFTDKYTWIPAYTKGAKGAPLLFDQNYLPKPAYRALVDAFNMRLHPVE